MELSWTYVARRIGDTIPPSDRDVLTWQVFRVTQRKALIALALLVPAPTLGATMAMWVAPGPIGKTIYFCCKCWILLLPVVWRMRVDKRPLSWSRPKRGGLAAGAIWGLTIAAAILVAFRLLAYGQVDSSALHEIAKQNRFDRPAVYLAFAAYLTLVNSLLEEYVWRWFVQSRCAALLPARAAVALAALFFTLHHVIALRSYLPWGATMAASAGVFLGGILWGWMYQRYGSVWPGFVSHALVDVGIFAIGWVLLF